MTITGTTAPPIMNISLVPHGSELELTIFACVICACFACLLSSCLAQKNDSYRSYINCIGTTVISVPNGFVSLASFSDGLAPVDTSHGWGYLDKMGFVAIQPQYATAQDFSGVELYLHNQKSSAGIRP